MAGNLSEHVFKQCNHTVAFVFAPNVQSAAGIYEIGSALRDAHMAAIFLMADATVADEAVEAMRKLGRKGRGPLIQAAEFDFSIAYGADAANPHFRVGELPDDLLHVMKALSESVLDIYEYVLVADASQPALTEDTLKALYENVNTNISEFSPYLLLRDSLESF